MYLGAVQYLTDARAPARRVERGPWVRRAWKEQDFGEHGYPRADFRQPQGHASVVLATLANPQNQEKDLRRPRGRCESGSEADPNDVHQFVIIRRLLKEGGRTSLQGTFFVALRIARAEHDDGDA
jgi:hypothetical protein